MYKYSVELYIKNEWVLQYRYYCGEKSLNDFDLHDIPNKRKNAKHENI